MRTARAGNEIEPTVSGIKADVPTAAQVREHAVVIGMTEQAADEFFAFWTNAGWKDRNGSPVRNWRAKLASRKMQIEEKKAKERTDGLKPARRRVADNHFQTAERPYDGAF